MSCSLDSSQLFKSTGDHCFDCSCQSVGICLRTDSLLFAVCCFWDSLGFS